MNTMPIEPLSARDALGALIATLEGLQMHLERALEMARWHDAEAEQPPTDGERVFVGFNENGYCACFNLVGAAMPHKQCYMQGPEETVSVMGGLKWWRELDRPLR